MRLTILTYGTRGDVQPYVALGQGLIARGHQVSLAAPEQFADFATDYGLDFYPLPGNIADLVLNIVDGTARNPVNRLLAYFKFAIPLAIEVSRTCAAAVEESDGILHAFFMNSSGEMLATQKGIKHMGCLVLPMFTPTVEFPLMIFQRQFPGWINKLTHQLFQKSFWWMTKFAYTVFIRPKDQSLPPLTVWPFSPGKPYDVPIVYGVSASVLPRPTDWPPNRSMTGFWYLDSEEAYSPPLALRSFLAAGPAPIYIGFGSMMTRDPEKVQRAVLEAIRITEKRVVLSSGWGGFAEGVLPENIFTLDTYVPHEWLFPRMAAIVHHGGAGTTAAALRAGKPTVIVPFGADQPFWGRRVAELGVGPAPILKRQLTGERLAAAIREATTNEAMKARATALGEQLRAEHGVETAVELIETYFAS